MIPTYLDQEIGTIFADLIWKKCRMIEVPNDDRGATDAKRSRFRWETEAMDRDDWNSSDASFMESGR